MSTLEYGSAEFYAEQFSDILADVDSENDKYAANIIAGFLMSIDDWLKYHDNQANAYREIRERVCQALAVQ
jgi:hypothetical protein